MITGFHALLYSDDAVGLFTSIRLPGGGELGLDQPTHKVAIGLP